MREYSHAITPADSRNDTIRRETVSKRLTGEEANWTNEHIYNAVVQHMLTRVFGLDAIDYLGTIRLCAGEHFASTALFIVWSTRSQSGFSRLL